MLQKIITTHDESIIINTDQMCSFQKFNSYVLIKMSNGDHFVVKHPTYDAWENDLFMET